MMRSYEPKIKKEDLEIGAYYNGHCRNTTIEAEILQNNT